MKMISIESLLSVYEKYNDELFQKYLLFKGCELKKHEIDSLKSLVEYCPIVALYKFYIGYEIPQLGKEFDLLKITEKEVFNLELKMTSTKKDVKKQLKRNMYYLEALGKEIILLTYIASDEKLYKLDLETKTLIELDEFLLVDILSQLDNLLKEHINTLFNPSKYLVAPFNEPDKFINHEYILTPEQENHFNEIYKSIYDHSINFISIKAGPGTGKTLLTYHLGKEVNKDLKVLIIHCAPLSSGHFTLSQKSGIKIIHPKQLNKINIEHYDVMIVDEAQRIYKRQLNKIIKEVKNKNKTVLFSYDPKQRISDKEFRSNSIESIEEFSEKTYRLRGRIRTNKELSSFIKNLFDLSKRNPNISYNNVSLEYFTNPNRVYKYIQKKEKEDWKYIQFSNSNYNPVPYNKYQGTANDFNSHHAIGQEFENVIVVIDSSFYYKKGRLVSNGYTGGTGYDMGKMLYQNITRVRQKLKVIVLNNELVFETVLSIISQK